MAVFYIQLIQKSLTMNKSLTPFKIIYEYVFDLHLLATYLMVN